MKRLLLPLLAALALPISVNATDYVECEAIYSLITRTENQKEEMRVNSMKYPNIYSFNTKTYDDVINRANRDFYKRGCYGI
tara:strand:+ start:191 stop:433 length:243 start_codon:yes stop_codon:yes gene_type:complete